MLDKVYFSNGHLTSLAFLVLENGGFELGDKQLILSHVSNCTFCMERYVNSLTEDSLLEPSEELPNRIMDVIHSEQNAKKNTKVIVVQFAKLGIAVCLTMTIFFSGLIGFTFAPPAYIENDRTNTVQQSEPQVKKVGVFSSFANSVNQGFFDFAEQINLGFKGATLNGTK